MSVKPAWLGFIDSGIPEDDPLPEGCFALEPVEKAAEPLVRFIREFRPHVITDHPGAVRRLVRGTRPGTDRPRHPNGPGRPVFRVLLDVRREIWPTEEYELARSPADTSLPEDALFAGVSAHITA